MITLDTILEVLKAGGCIRRHTGGRGAQYRLLNRDAAPVSNMSAQRFTRLKNKQLIKKVDKEYIYCPKKERKEDRENRKYACTFVGHGKVYLIEAPTVGRAKYILYRLVRKQKPSITYSDMRGKLYNKVIRPKAAERKNLELSGQTRAAALA